MSLPYKITLPTRIKRWTPRHKENLIRALVCEEITVVDACRIYGFSVDELDRMLNRYLALGKNGLKVSKLQQLGAP